MAVKNAFVELAEVQREQGTMYCAGLDIHPFGGFQESLAAYGASWINRDPIMEAIIKDYWLLTDATVIPKGHDEGNDLAILLSQIEYYVMNLINFLVFDCNIRVFKPQLAFYVQFGPAGFFLLSRIRNHIRKLEQKLGNRLITILDCKVGDIDTTQAASFTAYLGNLKSDWGIDYAPFDFDIINVTPWMGSDVLVLGNEGKFGLGRRLMEAGKGIIVVSKSSNPSGPEFQEKRLQDRDGTTLQMANVENLKSLSANFKLEQEGLSAIGLVVGSTHPCDGKIRKAFPETTLLIPGFGAQGGKFEYIMPELIREGKWQGQGAIFSSSRGTMFPWQEKMGGSGLVANLKSDLIAAIKRFRENEKAAFETAAVKQLGIEYPFAKN